MENNEHRLVPGQSRLPNLGKLRKLAQVKPAAAGRPSTSLQAAAPQPRTRRFRRAGSAWAGALTLASMLMAVAALVLLDRGGALRSLVRVPAAPARPDAALGPEAREKLWALAEYDPARFASLMGARPDDPARMEENARKLERLLSSDMH